MVKLEYTVLNAFTQAADSGNPAAVIVLPRPTTAIDSKDPFVSYPPTETLQHVATKLNYPMTAFLLPQDASKGQYLLRWLDPGAEVQLCGHATVALSHHLFSQADAPSKLELTTVKHGLVAVESMTPPLSSTKGDKRVAIDFPEILGFNSISPGSERWQQVEQGLKEVTGRSLELEALSENGAYIIIEIKRGQHMDAKSLPLKLEELSHFEGTSVLLTQVASTSTETGGPHIYTRVLHALSNKKDEDAATGSAHCALIPYYLTSERHRQDFPEESTSTQCLYVHQQSAEGGEMYVQWLQDRKKVRIFGSAVHIGKGEIDMKL